MSTNLKKTGASKAVRVFRSKPSSSLDNASRIYQKVRASHTKLIASKTRKGVDQALMHDFQVLSPYHQSLKNSVQMNKQLLEKFNSVHQVNRFNGLKSQDSATAVSPKNLVKTFFRITKSSAIK